MTRISISLFLLLVGAAAGQEFKLPPGIEKLAAKAAESVDVTLDSSMLQLAAKFLSDRKPDEAQAKKLISGLKSIYVRSFEFDKPGEYSETDVEAVRSQFRAPGWSRIVGVRSRKEGENAEVFLKNEGGSKIGGLAIIAADPKELTIVNIVGQIDPEQLNQLSGQFGIPKVEVKKKTGKD